MVRRRPTRLLRVLKETGPVIAAVLAGMILITVVAPATAQLFPFFGGGPSPRAQRGGNGFGGGGFFGNDFFQPFQQQAPRRQDFSRAPSPEKRDPGAPLPERNVVVLGDAMADWLAYGLEDAYSEQTEIGVTRKHKTVSGLIRYQPKGDPADWPAAARGILAAEKPDAVVIMLGLHDRIAMRDTAADKKAARPGEARSDAARPDGAKPEGAKPDAEATDDSAEIADPPSIVAPERGGRGSPQAGSVEFRDDRWTELYVKKIDEMIAVAKAKNVPVLWVGLPALRGVKPTADMLYLNGLYRDGAGRAGITYVDVWDGFVDESGRFLQQGPDFEGQIRRLRSNDGVFFTKAGARKLAHYVEREIGRLLAARTGPVPVPTDQPLEDDVKPSGPAPRPLAGPIIPLVVSSLNSDVLLGAPGTRTLAADPLVAKLIVRGEAMTPPPGRADDGAWPRREVGREVAPKGGDMPAMVNTGNGATPLVAALAPPPKPKRPRLAQPPPQQTFGGFFSGFGNFGAPPPQPVRGRPQQRAYAPPSGGFGGFFR